MTSEQPEFAAEDPSAVGILSETAKMPSLEAMHRISANNPSAQARFYFLMQEGFEVI